MAAAVAGSLALATAAHAQLGDVGENTIDTDVTPVAKESVKWEWWAGARYKGTPDPSDVPEGSATPFELDFFDVAFRDANNGLAGGAVCREPVPDGATPEEALAHTTTCERVPALYRYSVDEVEGASWSPVELPSRLDEDKQEARGYIGAIAWLDANRALIVGGDGCYPRREEPCPDGNTPTTPQGDPDPAGMARAWLYEGGSVRELTNLPAQMRGLTALDAPFIAPATAPRLSDCDSDGVETQWGCAFAGALRQVWQFRDGAFVRGWSGDESTPEAPQRGDIFQFRVRDLRFAYARDFHGLVVDEAGEPVDVALPAIAVTAGCCTEDPTRSGPRILVFDGATWYVRQNGSDLSNIADVFGRESKREAASESIGLARSAVERGWDGPRSLLEDCPTSGSVLACTYENGRRLPLVGNPFPNGFDDVAGPWPNPPDDLLAPVPEPDLSTVDDAYQQPHRELERQTRPYGANAQIPDSYYALFGLTVRAGSVGVPPSNPSAAFSLVASVGGPTADRGGATEASEPASHVFPGSVATESSNPEVAVAGVEGVDVPYTFGPRPSISSNQERLLTTARLNSADGTTIPPQKAEAPPNNFEAVGVLRSSGQGIAFGPREQDPHRVNESLQKNRANFPQDKEAHGCDTSGAVPQCEADAQRFIDQQRSLRLFKLDSYTLNAVDVLDDPLDKGAGWAVGDHGAIQSLDGQTSAQAQAHEPLPPRLGERKQGELPDASAYDAFREELSDEPGQVPSLGASAEFERFDEHRFVPAGDPISQVVMSRDGSEGWGFSSGGVAHFDGLIWRPCGDTSSTPDTSCPDLGSLASASVSIDTLVRIPLEHDNDPSNDEEFAVLAFTSEGAILYRDGRWREDHGPLSEGLPTKDKVTSAAFVGPDEGWAVVGPENRPDRAGIYHFDGDGWTACGGFGAAPPECADPERRLHIQQASPIGGSSSRPPRIAAAGERVYVFGTRMVRASFANNTGTDPVYPLILYRDPGGTWQGSADGSDGGLDPGFFAQGGAEEPPIPDKTGLNPAVDNIWGTFVAGPANALSAIVTQELERQLEGGSGEGRVYALGVTVTPVGALEGWAAGEFGGKGSDAKAVMLRLEGGRWGAWPRADASDDYLHFTTPPGSGLELTALPAPVGAHDAFLTGGGQAPLAFNAQRGRWEAFDLPFVTRVGKRPLTGTQWNGRVETLTPDGGGLWVSARTLVGSGVSGGTLYRYANHALKPVFREVPSPVRDGTITTSAAGGDGSFWLGADSNVLYRYDRELDWDSILIPGWDTGRVVTNPSGVNDLALGGDGRGIAVGERGRIAEIGPEGARLDEAAGTLCYLDRPRPPCGTGRDLTSAAVAPDGSALVGGAGLTSLLYRPAGGEFRHIDPPARQPASSVVELALPTPERAYLVLGSVTSGNRLFRGERIGEGFRWQLELETGGITQIEIAPSGHGFALAGGQLLERAEDGTWKVLETGYEGRFGAIAAPVGGPGLIAGGEDGLLLTLQDGRFRVAHQPDPFSPLRGNNRGGFSTTELALIPGSEAGQVEAWAIAQGGGGQFSHERGEPAHALLHYASDPSLDPLAGLRPLPDALPPRPGEISFAAFGKQDCQKPELDCFEQGGRRTHAVIQRQIVDEIRTRAEREGGAAFALHTGDGVDSPTPERMGLGGSTLSSTAQTPANRDRKIARFVEHTADRLTDANVPVFGAIGGQDLATSQIETCPGSFGCAGNQGASIWFWSGVKLPSLGAGPNAYWRRATAIAPAPWERPGGIDEGALHFEPVADPLAIESPEAEVEDPRSGEALKAGLPNSFTAGMGISESPELRAEVRRGGRTHYAFDVIDESQDGRSLARIVVVDTSLGSLAASDVQSEPKEPGGQLAWLERMLCIEGSAQDTGGDVQDCTREPGQRAIVLSNRPTYTYAQIDPSKLAQDAALLESTLLRYDVDVLVTGHLGWNGLYYACAPGLHYPAPGQGYPTRAPNGVAECAAAAGSEEVPDLAGEATGALAGTPTGALPVVVASGAGGVLADETGKASDGYWHGYSIVHLDAETGEVQVEQRPVFEWVAIRGDERTLEPRQQMTLRGYGREVFGQDTNVRHLDIDSPAVTHRYDLLLADPEDPRVPCSADDLGCQALQSRLAEGSRFLDSAIGSADRSARNDMGECDPYLCLPERVATIDSTTGEMRAGNGKYPDTFAIGMLSVGDHVATYPLVFKKSPSFIVSALGRPPAIPVPDANVPNSPNAPPPPPVPTPKIPQANTPEPPLPPAVPPITATEPPEPQPPAPPSPPPPTEQPSPLDLTVSPTALTVATPAAVIQPPTPPVNPAPPSGARREARQRQAATQKSGADIGDERSSEISEAGGDRADTPPSPQQSMTRHDHASLARARQKPEPSFTLLARATDSPPLGQGLLYGGGIALLAATLALGWQGARPTPRRRPPEIPAPAWNSVARRRG